MRPKVYSPDNDGLYTSTMLSFDEIQQSMHGDYARLPVQEKTFSVPHPGDYEIIQFPCQKPVSVFATGLLTCGAFIYFYPQKHDAKQLDHIVVYHAPSSVISNESLPTAPRFNTNGCSAKNIKVIIGTANRYDVSLDDAVKFLVQNQIPIDNINVYIRCKGTFGVDSFGNVGELGEPFKAYVNRVLTNVFIHIMQNSLEIYLNQPIFAKSDSSGFYPRHTKEGGKNHAEEFYKILSKNNLDNVIEYLEKGSGGLTPQSLKSIFMQQVVKTFNEGFNVNYSFPEKLDAKVMAQFLNQLKNKLYNHELPIKQFTLSVVTPKRENKL